MSVMRLVAFVVSALVSGSSVPQAPIETLSGKRLELSRDIAPGLAVLIVGFTKASRAQTSEWARRLEPDVSRAFTAQVYEVAVVADVPRLIRGIVIDQIRASVPKAIHPHFLLVLEQAEVWRQLAGAADESAACLVLVSHGEVVWRRTGRLTEVGYQSLIQALRAVSPDSAPSGHEEKTPSNPRLQQGRAADPLVGFASSLAADEPPVGQRTGRRMAAVLSRSNRVMER